MKHASNTGEVLERHAEKKRMQEEQRVKQERKEALAPLEEEKKKLQEEIDKLKEKLLLNEQAREILDKKDELLREAEELCSEMKAEAKEKADELLKDAEKQSTEKLNYAEKLKRETIDGVTNVADLAAKKIRDDANAYEKDMRSRADKEKEEILQYAHMKAEEITSQAREYERRQAERLHTKELELSQREAEIPEKADTAAAERTAKQREILDLRQKELTEQAERQELERTRLKVLRDSLEYRKEKLSEEADRLLAERFAAQNEDYKQLKDTLNSTLAEYNNLRENYDRLVCKYKTTPKDVEKLRELENANISMQKQLDAFEVNGISPGEVRNIVQMKERLEAQETYINKLQISLADATRRANENTNAADERDQAEMKAEQLEDTLNDLMEKYSKRMEISRETRLGPIQAAPVLLTVDDSLEKDPEEYADECRWLKHIQTQSEESGIIFNERQLMAYHTCLKVGEWSPLVVLSGVSGTGKSELPKQYARHGGMQFVSLPVKPDWDSPASLFGYYNSIENKFEATELLRALYQMQTDRQTPWSDSMLLVLLDEMNLAHPEQYFADLLSKFEETRNSGRDAVYEIGLGAGEPPEQLHIGRNVLWTGTMNEDETTKGLSDKVVDRSMIINFPCPKKLYSRGRKEVRKPELILTRKRWKEWQDKALTVDLNDSTSIRKELEQRRQAVEDVNGAMSAMGRNLGHRVWQSIENYVLNYPEVIAAYHKKGDLEGAVQKAFCDALAFKMMPKLRGLETGGANEEYFEQLKKMVHNHAADMEADFEKACTQTSEVFQWSSAKFMGM